MNGRWKVAGVCLFLAAIIWAVFGQTLHYGFVNYDDDKYVYDNPEVEKGLTWAGVRWAFTHFHAANWHPLTWISHMLDCQIYGLNAGGHHFTNVLLHTATAIVLFLVLRRMTGSLWRSAFVAAVFAIHPLRVESVAWVSERKDVLSGLFFMLTLGAYVRYAQNPRSVARYALVVALFALGLMCKPMLVTLPLVLLLLDYWPLNRMRNAEPGKRNFTKMLLEKIPLFILTAASCVITIFAQARAIQPMGHLTLLLRVENALASYATYLGQMFWPSGLAIFYPFAPGGVGMPKVLLSLALLAGISTTAVLLRRRCPYLLTGWLWYLIMLVPVIGIVQVGLQAHADRYTYLPQIGLYLALAWAAGDWGVSRPYGRRALGVAASGAILVLTACAWKQTSYWRNSESLWARALAVAPDNSTAENDFAEALLDQGKVNEAIPHLRRALQFNPDNEQARNNLGNALLQKGEVDEGMAQLQQALAIQPDFAQAHNDLGNALLRQGKADEAIAQFHTALQINPRYPEAHYDLGNALFQKGDLDGAIRQYQQALQINPDYANAHGNLGFALFQKGREAEAISHYEKALQINPHLAEVQNNLAWVLATSSQPSLRNGSQALELARRANRSAAGKNPIFLATLAAADAAVGRFDDAAANVQKARDFALALGDTNTAATYERMLALFKSGRAIGQNPSGSP